MFNPHYLMTSMMGLLVMSALGINAAPFERSHPRLMADSSDIERAKEWVKEYSWYRNLFDQHKEEIDRFLEHKPIFVSPVKQTYQYKMYTCPKHDVELLYEEFRPYEHHCPVDTSEVHREDKYNSAWAGWYNRRLADHLVWMGILYQVYGDERYAEEGREILLKFADLYLKYPTENTILGPAHVFFGTLSESFWGVDMAYGYDLLYNYRGFRPEDRLKIKEQLFYPLAQITQQFPESASNRQLWYNNVSAAVGFLYGDQKLVDFALKGQYGFDWQLGSALPESGFWAEWSGYHFVALRGMIHLAEMARHNGLDLYHTEIAGRTMEKMFDAPFEVILPNYEFPRSKDSGGGSILEYATFYEIGYSVYKDPKYLAVLNLSDLQRGVQIVGEESGARQVPAPITVFNLVPDLPKGNREIYPDASVNLEGNGFAVLRNGEGKNRRYLYLDYGIVGGEHGHPDRLQIGYHALGQNWIVDPLNESYFNPNLQLWYRQTIAHNTVVTNQTSQTWANGYGKFFGALPALQVASGSSRTIYPGANLTRTLLQVGDYFIDLCDISCREKRIIDWPLHSFGKLSISGIVLKNEPEDRFGKPLGIPGYDQLKNISSGLADTSWVGVFTTDSDEHLSVYAIPERGTQVFRATTPPIGGFYKQMVKDQNPLPMLISRRVTDSTRFAHLIQAYSGKPSVVGFEKGSAPLSYHVQREDGEDILYADVEHSVYWVVKTAGDRPTLAAGVNLKEIRSGDVTLVDSDLPLSEFECRWHRETLSLMLPAQFARLKVWAPSIRRVERDGRAIAFERDSDYVLIRQLSGVSLEVVSPEDGNLFLGRKNPVTIRVRNSMNIPAFGQVALSLQGSWLERVGSQLNWWGGIVNLKATNKGPIQRTAYPTEFRKDVKWIDSLSSQFKSIAAGDSATIDLQIEVPNDAPPVSYDVTISFGSERIEKSFLVVPPITAEVMLPNAEEEVLWVELRNRTRGYETVSMDLIPHKAWSFGRLVAGTISLAPREVRRVDIPLRLIGYGTDNQLYPIRLQLESGRFRTEFVRDFYVGIAHFAKAPPALDGSWNGWDKSEPMTIDKPSQVCRLLMGNQAWQGPNDLSAKIYAMYDDSSLYVGAEVTDDVLVTHWNFPTMSYPWDTDCMEVVLDVRSDSEQGHDPPTPGLFRNLSMAELRTIDFGPTMWQGGGAGGPLLPKPNLVPGAETYFLRTPSGYNMICRYPLSSLKGVIAKPGYKIGFDAAINDNDGTNYRKNQHIWAGFNQNQSWWDMGTIGALVFGRKD
jgi:hypothetical protein